MQELEHLRYTPPDSLFDLDDLIPRTTPKQDPGVNDFNDIQNLIDKYDLLQELSDYCEKMIDNELENVKIAYEPELFPEVYRAMTRLFPNDDPTLVTYQHYKKSFDVIFDMVEKGML